VGTPRSRDYMVRALRAYIDNGLLGPQGSQQVRVDNSIA